VAVRRRRPADPRGAEPASRHPALDDSLVAQRSSSRRKGGFLNALARFDPFPSVQGAVPSLPRPNARVARDPDVRAATRSTIRVLGTACGLGIEGSGWVAGPGLVVTKRPRDRRGERHDGATGWRRPRYAASAVWFDARNDIAILPRTPSEPSAAGRERECTGRHLRRRDRLPGERSARRAARAPRSDHHRADQDAYGRGPIRRKITTLRGLVRSGNSGGPVVDGAGRVLTTVFASSVSSGAAQGLRRARHGRPRRASPPFAARSAQVRARAEASS